MHLSDSVLKSQYIILHVEGLQRDTVAKILHAA